MRQGQHTRMLFDVFGTKFLKSLNVQDCMSINIFIEQLNMKSSGFYLFKGSNGNTRKMCKMCLKLTINTPERRQ